MEIISNKLRQDETLKKNARLFHKLKQSCHICTMIIISKKTIRDHAQKRPDHCSALERWFDITTKADWSSFSEMKKDFNSVDGVGNRFCPVYRQP